MTPLDVLTLLAAEAQSPLEPVPSPCVSVCRMHEHTGLCLGCFRTIDEIVAWGRQSDATRRDVWQHIVRRASIELTSAP